MRSYRAIIYLDGTLSFARKLFVGGLHEDTNNDELKCYFCRFGAVEDAIVMIDSTTNRSRGFGFVTFKEPESVQNVFSMPDHLIHRKKVRDPYMNSCI